MTNASSAFVAESAIIWEGTKVREGAHVGENSSIGLNCYVGPGVRIGDNCSIQNGALIYEPAVVGDAVFIGPNVIVTNDLNPRAVNASGQRKTVSDWVPQAALIEEGASIGAGAILIGPIRIGKWAMVGAGSLVNSNVRDFEIVVGSPARHFGWVGKLGHKLLEVEPGVMRCPKSGQKFQLDQSGKLLEL